MPKKQSGWAPKGFDSWEVIGAEPYQDKEGIPWIKWTRRDPNTGRPVISHEDARSDIKPDLSILSPREEEAERQSNLAIVNGWEREVDMGKIDAIKKQLKGSVGQHITSEEYMRAMEVLDADPSAVYRFEEDGDDL